MDQVTPPSGFRFGFGFMMAILVFLLLLPVATCVGCAGCAACVAAIPTQPRSSDFSSSTNFHPAPISQTPVVYQPSAEEMELEEYKQKVEIRKIHLDFADDDELSVFGEVKNTGQRSIARLELQVQCLDKDGQAVFEKDFLLLNTQALFAMNGADKPLKPNFSRKFGIGLKEVPNSEWAKKVNVKVKNLKFE